MSCTLIWSQTAVAALIRLRSADPEAVRQVRKAVNALATDPLPASSTPLGDGFVHRLRVADLRVMYEILPEEVAVHILSVGRLGR